MAVSSNAVWVPQFSVGTANDAAIGLATVTATAPTTYGMGTSYICTMAGTTTGHYGDFGYTLYTLFNAYPITAFGTAGWFTAPAPAGLNLAASEANNATVLIWSQAYDYENPLQTTPGCFATEASDYSYPAYTTQSSLTGPLVGVAIAVNAPIAGSWGTGGSDGYWTYGGSVFPSYYPWSYGHDSLTYTVPSSVASGSGFVILDIACSSFQCSSISVPPGCTHYGTYIDTQYNWNFYGGGNPMVNLYTCNSVSPGSYTVTAVPTPQNAYGIINECDTNLLNNEVGVNSWASGLYSCATDEVEIAAYLFQQPTASGLKTPVLTSSPALPAAMDAGTSITLYSSNLGGGTSPYTYKYTIFNSISKAVVASQQYTNIPITPGLTTSGQYTWQIPSSLIGSTLSANFTITDSSSPAASASSSQIGPLTVKPPLSTPTLTSNPGLPDTITVGQPITFAASWSGGTSPYNVTYTISNSITKVPVYKVLNSGILGTTNTLTWVANSIGTFIANVVIYDSAGVPTSASSAYSGTLTVSPANVLIVTAGVVGDSTSTQDIQAYKAEIQKQGLSTLYVELDSANYTSITGLPNPTMTDWTGVKFAINKLETIGGVQYLLILGDGTVVPMANVIAKDLEIIQFETNPTTSSNSAIPVGLGLPKAIIPTDDPYGNTTIGGTIPTIVVARMPGSTTSEINLMLLNAVYARQNGNSNLGVVTDTSPFPGSSESMLDATNIFLKWAISQTCDEISGICKQSPPYCEFQGSSPNPDVTPPGCTPALLDNFIKQYGILYFGCHGSGWECLGSTDFYPILITSGTIPTLLQRPIILTEECFGAEIPGTELLSPLANYLGESTSEPTIAQSFLNSGASAYIGVTIEGLTNQQDPAGIGWTNTALAFVYQDFYTNGNTIGMSFLTQKQYMEEFDSTNLYTDFFRDQGYALQLYGDPTLTYTSLGSGS